MKYELTVIVPSRGRPHAAHELADTFNELCTTRTRLIFALDDDDLTSNQYPQDEHVEVRQFSSHSMVEALNFCHISLFTEDDESFAVGFMGDDHRPRTYGWDTRYVGTLRAMGTGIVYGNDLFQGPNLPTQVVMTSDIPAALGYMAPWVLRHLYVDNYWKDLGQGAGCIQYLPDVIIEHMHPFAGKAEMTEGHERVNAREVYLADEAAYKQYTLERLQTDIEIVKRLIVK